ncbi:hypothetical protein GBA52_001147 [Prunus armeniaca]|nr:hypothetical protein GBA52_001147 [Prunus armeniaca]
MKHDLTQQGPTIILVGKESRSKTRTTEERDMIGELVRGSFKVMKDIAKQTQEELINLRMKEGGNLTEHFNTFNLCITGLQKVNVVDSTEDVAMMLWAPLPSSYKHFRKMLLIGKSILNFEEVVEDLVHHGLAQNSGDSSQGEGLLT